MLLTRLICYKRVIFANFNINRGKNLIKNQIFILKAWLQTLL